MPTDVVTFDMLRKSVLEGLSDAMLQNEVGRVGKMQDAVNEYWRLVLEVIAGRLTRGPENDAPSPR